MLGALAGSSACLNLRKLLRKHFRAGEAAQ